MPWKWYGLQGAEKAPIVQSSLESGDVSLFAGPMSGAAGSLTQAKSAPSGYLFCNGAVINTVTDPEYGPLYDKITKDGTVGLFGAFTATTATLPNFRGKYLRGSANGANPGATSTVSSTHTHTIQDHRHLVIDHTHGISEGGSGHTHGMFNHTHPIPSHNHGAGTLAATEPGTLQIGSNAGGGTKVGTANHGHDISGATGFRVGVTNGASPNEMNDKTGGDGSTNGTNVTNSDYSTGQVTPSGDKLLSYLSLNMMIKV